MSTTAHDRSQQLQQLMRQVGLFSFKALSLAAGVSERQVKNLRQGKIAAMSVETLVKFSQALQITLTELLINFSDSDYSSLLTPPSSRERPDFEALRQEYDRLQAQLTHQRQELWQEFQQSSLQILESLLLQLPTAAYAAQQNPQAPAVKLLPLLRPIDQLLEQWEIGSIGTVGAEIPYDPQQHQLLDGTAQSGDRVRVRYVGYRQGERLLYRAKVSQLRE